MDILTLLVNNLPPRRSDPQCGARASKNTDSAKSSMNACSTCNTLVMTKPLQSLQQIKDVWIDFVYHQSTDTFVVNAQVCRLDDKVLAMHLKRFHVMHSRLERTIGLNWIQNVSEKKR